MIALIFAQAENGVIGRNNDLPWHLPDDLRHFKRLTTGHTIVMGRRTFESIGRALPNRRSIVVTRGGGPALDEADVERAASWDDVSRLTEDDERVYIIGGADLFRVALPHATQIYRTLVHADVPGDVRLPPLPDNEWRLVHGERHEADERHQYPFTFQELRRITE